MKKKLIEVALPLDAINIVEFLYENIRRVCHVRQPLQREPDFGVTSVNYDFGELLAKAEKPR